MRIQTKENCQESTSTTVYPTRKILKIYSLNKGHQTPERNVQSYTINAYDANTINAYDADTINAYDRTEAVLSPPIALNAPFLLGINRYL